MTSAGYWVDTMARATPPASQIRPGTGWNTLEYTLQMVSPAMITLTSRMALIGECVRGLTSASFSGISRSKDQANSDRIGMNVFAIIDGRLQNRKQPRMITVTNGTFTDSAARNG